MILFLLIFNYLLVNLWLLILIVYFLNFINKFNFNLVNFHNFIGSVVFIDLIILYLILVS